jgi:radical SAM superfamily enzyme YgiQ (UPF0313 family)
MGNRPFFGVYEPLVLEIFSAIAKEENCEVVFVDLRFDRRACERLAGQGYVPDLIATSAHGFAEVYTTNRLVEKCRRLWPRAAVVVGGLPATLRPEWFNAANIDVIVRGPGERVWRDLCRRRIGRNDALQVIQDPEPPLTFSFPLPDRAITRPYRKHYTTNMPHYTGKRLIGPTGFTVLTQGCPFRCSFCVIPPGNLGMFRKRPIAEIVAELKTIEEPYIYFGDDNTFFDAAFADELADRIREAGLQKEYATSCRADHICAHPELLRKWHAIGLRYLVVGVEAVTEEQLVRLKKKTHVDENVQALRILREIGIYALPHIVATPDMTRRDFDAIYRFIEENGCEYPVSAPLTPMPGTADYDLYASQGRLLTDDLRYYNFLHNVVRPTHLSVRDWDREFFRFTLRVWSPRRYFQGKFGRLPFRAVLMRWLFMRVFMLLLLFQRRKFYRTVTTTTPPATP